MNHTNEALNQTEKLSMPFYHKYHLTYIPCPPFDVGILWINSSRVKEANTYQDLVEIYIFFIFTLHVHYTHKCLEE